jgi:hypothetical protein
MNFNEQRVRTAFDGVLPQWREMDDYEDEEWRAIMEMLHDDAIDEIQEKIDGILDSTVTEGLEDADWTELIRRLRVEYPQAGCETCGDETAIRVRDHHKRHVCMDCWESMVEWSCSQCEHEFRAHDGDCCPECCHHPDDPACPCGCKEEEEEEEESPLRLGVAVLARSVV